VESCQGGLFSTSLQLRALGYSSRHVSRPTGSLQMYKSVHGCLCPPSLSAGATTRCRMQCNTVQLTTGGWWVELGISLRASSTDESLGPHRPLPASLGPVLSPANQSIEECGAGCSPPLPPPQAPPPGRRVHHHQELGVRAHGCNVVRGWSNTRGTGGVSTVYLNCLAPLYGGGCQQRTV
jgi:hypothetical protein